MAACAGIIVFGSLMAAMFIGQQFLQNVLGYSTLDAGLAILPAAVLMVLVAPRSAKIVEARGARFTLLLGYAFCLLGFLTMLLLWKEDISYWKVGTRLRVHRDRRRVRRNAGLAFPHRVRARHPRRNGLGHGGPPARPRRRHHAVDLRRAADGGLCLGGRGGNRRGARTSRRSPTTSRAQLTEVVRQRRGRRISSTRSTPTPDHGRGEVVVPPGRRVGLHRRHRRDPARRGDRLLLLPAQGTGRGAARAVPRRGHSAVRLKSDRDRRRCPRRS